MRSKGAGSSCFSLTKDHAEPAGLRDLLIQLSKAKLKGAHAVEGSRDLTRQQLVAVCTTLEQHVQTAIQRVHLALTNAGMEDDDDGSAAEEALLILRGGALLAHDILAQLAEPPPQQLQDAAVAMHDNALLVLGVDNSYVAVQDPVARLCTAWWERSVVGKELLVAQTLPYLLVRAVAPGSKAADVKQCFLLRDALSLYDFDDPSINDTKHLLLRAAFSPSFLERPEGRRFIASLFGHQPAFVKELTAIVRNQIPSGRKPVLDAYAEITTRAWRDTQGGPCAYEVESELIQGLMSATISARTPALAGALIRVLDGLHEAKKNDKRVDAMLCRLYEPILFRAFGATNAAVRRNALQLLLAAFPIWDPDAAATDTSALLTQQLQLLRDCLSDACPKVREVAVAGTCQVLNLYWEIIPAATSALFISKLTDELAYDQASVQVRVAAVDGLRLLVDNKHAQPVLKKALPVLAQLLGDSALKVREAMALLLVAISASRELHFYDMVPLEALLHAMAHDLPSVARRIQRILVPSYFPNPQEGSARVAALLRAHPAAGQAFCRQMVSSYVKASNAGTGEECDDEAAGEEGTAAMYGFSASVPIEHVLQLAGDLCAHLVACVHTLQAPGSTAEEASEARSPAPKRPKGGRKGKREQPAAAGKRRKQAVGSSGNESGTVGQQHPEADHSEEQEALVDEPETIEAWASILRGLAQLCRGIGASVAADACTAADVGLILPDDRCLEHLATAVIDKVQTPEAMQDVMAIASSLHFTHTAQRLRNHLFAALEQGALPGLAPMLGGDEGAAAVAAGQQDGLLLAVLEALSTGTSAPKLAAMLMSAVGAREPGCIHKPLPPKKAAKANGRSGQHHHEEAEAHAAAGHSDEGSADNIRCGSCLHLQPEDNMLLCDGCDAAFHTHCMRPEVEGVPVGDWFCGECEEQIQRAVHMPRTAALRCISLVAGLPSGRELLRNHADHKVLLEALHASAAEQVEELVTRGSADPSSADSASSPASGLAAQQRYDDMGLACRLALHIALTALSSPDDANEDAEQEEKDDAGGAGAAANSVGACSREARTAEALLMLVHVLTSAVSSCQKLAEAVQGADPDVCCSALSFCCGVLKVLCDAQHLQLLTVSDGHYIMRMCELCNVLLALICSTHEALHGAAGGSDDGDRSMHPAVVGSFELLLRLTGQLAQAAAEATLLPSTGKDVPGHSATVETGALLRSRRGKGAAERRGSDGSGQEDDETSQQLEDRLNAAGDKQGLGNSPGDAEADQAGVLPPGEAVERLACAMVQQLSRPGVCALVEGARKNLYTLVKLLLQLAQQGQGQWLQLLCASVGSAMDGFTGFDQLLGSSAQQPAGLIAEGGAAATAAAPEAATAVRGVRAARSGAVAKAAATASGGGDVLKAASVPEQLLTCLKQRQAAVGHLTEVVVKAVLNSKMHVQAEAWLAAFTEEALNAGSTSAVLGAAMLYRMTMAGSLFTAATGGTGGRRGQPQAAGAVQARAKLQQLVAGMRALQPLEQGVAGGDARDAALELHAVIQKLVTVA